MKSGPALPRHQTPRKSTSRYIKEMLIIQYTYYIYDIIEKVKFLNTLSMTNNAIIYLNSHNPDVQFRVSIQSDNPITKEEMQDIRGTAKQIINKAILNSPVKLSNQKNVVQLKFERVDVSASEVTRHLGNILSLSAPLVGLSEKAPNPDEINEIELLFAMHLFRNGEKELLKIKSLLGGAQSEMLPLVDILQIWIGFLEQVPNDPKQEKLRQEIDALKNILCWEKEINNISELTNIKAREKGVAALTQVMLNKWELACKTKPPLPFYLPASKSLMPFVQAPAIIKIIMLEDQTIEFRAVGVLGTDPKQLSRGNSRFDLEYLRKRFNTSTKDPMYSFIENMVHISLGTPKTSVQRDLEAGKEPGLVSILKTTAEVQKAASTQKPGTLVSWFSNQNKVKYNYMVPVTAEKSFEVFLKNTGFEGFHRNKLLLKVATLLSLYAKGSDRLITQPGFRHWMRKNLLNAADSIQKKEQYLTPADIAFIKERLSEIVKHIDEIESVQGRVLPEKPLVAAVESFDERLKMDQIVPVKSLTPIPVISQEEMTQVLKFDKIDLKKFRSFVTSWNKMANKGKFHEIDLQLTSFFEQLQSLGEWWQNIPPTECKDWTALLLDVGKVVMRCNYGLGKIVPEPRHFVEMLRCFNIADHLCRKGYPEDIFAKDNYQLDLTSIQRVLKDPYFNVGPYWKEINHMISNNDRKDLKFLLARNYDGIGPNTRKFVKQMVLKKLGISFELYSKIEDEVIADHSLKGQPHKENVLKKLGTSSKKYNKIKEEVFADIGQNGHLSPSLAHLRQLYILMVAMSVPNRALLIGDLWNLLKIGMGEFKKLNLSKLLTNKSDDNQLELAKTALEANNTKVNELLSTGSGEIEIFADTTMIITEREKNGLTLPSFVLKPSGLHVVETELNYMVRFEFKPFDSYIKNDLEVLRELAEYLFEQMVASEEGDFVQPKTGIQEYHVDEPYREPTLQGKVQEAVMRETKTIAGIPPETLHELQMIRSGSGKQQFREAIGKLSKHAILLEHLEVGTTLRRFFEALLLHQDDFISTVQMDPLYFREMVSILGQTAREMKDSGHYGSYFFIVDMCQQMDNISQSLNISPRPTSIFLDDFEKQMPNLVEEANRNGSPLHSYRSMLHAYRLLIAARKDNVSHEEAFSFLESYCITKQWFGVNKWLSSEKQQRIDYLLFKLAGTLSKAVTRENCHNLARAINSALPLLQWKPNSSDGMVYKATDDKGSEYVLDLRETALWKEKKRSGMMGQEVTSHPAFSSIKKMLLESAYPDNLEEIPTIIRRVKIEQKDGIEAMEYSFTLNGKEFRLVMDTARNLSFYRLEQQGKQDWSQWVSKLEIDDLGEVSDAGFFGMKRSLAKLLVGEKKPVNKIPREIMNQYTCWISDDSKKVRLEKQGELVYEAKVADGKIVSLSDSRKMQVVIPWKDPNYHHFLAIDNPSNIIVKKDSRGEKVSVTYSRLGISYVKKGDLWEVEGMPGYYLSNKSLSQHFQNKPIENESHPAFVSELSTLFADSFTDYHLLQHDNGPLRIVVNCSSYGKKIGEMGQNFSIIPTKENLQQQIPSYKNLESSGGTSIVFTVDSTKGLVTEMIPEGYLYLAYLLAVQENYTDALRYLQKGMLHRSFSEQSKEILSWIKVIPQISQEAIEFLYRASEMLVLHAQQLNVTEMPKEKLEALIKEHQILRTKVKINAAEPASKFLEAYATEPPEKSVIILKSAISYFEKEISEKKDAALPAYVEPLEEPIPISPNRIDQEDMISLKVPNTSHAQRMEYMHNLKQDLNKINDPYAKEMADERVKDLDHVIQGEKKIEYIDPKKIPGLISRISHEVSQSKDEVLKLRHALLSMLPPPKTKEGGELLSLLKREKKHWNDVALDTSLRCYGEGDWSQLSKYMAFDIDKLSLLTRDYLKAATVLMQKEKALVELKKLNDLPAGTDAYTHTSDEVLTLYNGVRYYNPDKDIDAPTNLLLEYELGIILRRSQLKAVRKTIANPHLYMQVICGDGKSTVIRNIISHIRADGKTLACVSTLEPLRQAHGLLYARTTLHAFGQKVFEFKWDRKTPSDELSLLRLHLNLLETIHDRGRCDFTRSDLLSFKHTETLKRDRLAGLAESFPNAPDTLKLQRELDIIEDIRDLMKEKMIVTADELDKDCDPTQEKNFSYGSHRELDSNQVKAGLKILEWTLSLPELSQLCKALRNNLQADLPEEICSDALEVIAKKWFSEVSKKLNLEVLQENDFVNYMLGKDEFVAREDFYNTYIKDRFNEDFVSQICFGRDLLTNIIPKSFRKVSGVNFGRSEDGVRVIPYEGSDKPKEKSEHSSEAQQIWLTCIDYCQLGKGITPKNILKNISSIKKEALAEIAQVRLQDPNSPIDIDTTEKGKRFKAHFHIALSQVQAKDRAAIVAKIESGPKELVSFIEDWIFPEYKLTSEKIVGNAQDIPLMVNALGGASGTESSKRALPDSINISDVSQPGSYGIILKAVIDNEIKNNEKGIKTYHSYKDQKDLINLVSKLIKGGDCLTDVGISFPGVPAEDILRELSLLHPQIVFRFINRNDDWKMMLNGKVLTLDTTIPVSNVITLFDDTHTRGAERPSMNGVTEWLTIGENTGITRFEQGISRERKVLQGKASVIYFFPATIDAEQMTSAVLYDRLVTIEADQLRTLNDTAERQRIQAIVPHAIDLAKRAMTKKARTLGEKSHYSARALIDKHCRQYSIKSTKIGSQSAGKPNNMVDADKALDHLINEDLKNLKALQSSLEIGLQDIQNPSLIFLFLKEIKCAEDLLRAKLKTVPTGIGKPRLAKQYYSSKVSDSASNIEGTQESEKESEEEQEMEVEQELDQTREESEGTIFDVKREPVYFVQQMHNLFDEAYAPIGVIIPNFYKYNIFAPFQPKNKFFTSNFSEAHRNSKRGVKPWGLITKNQNVPPDQNLISRTLFAIDPKTNRVIEVVTSIYDNFILSNGLSDLQSQIKPYLFSMYNYDTGRVDEGSRWDALTPDQIKQVKRLIVSTMFQRGDLVYPNIDSSKIKTYEQDLKNLYPVLVDWLREQPNLKEMMYSFRRFRAACCISGQKIAGSDLARAFKEAEAYQKQEQLYASPKPQKEVRITQKDLLKMGDDADEKLKSIPGLIPFIEKQSKDFMKTVEETDPAQRKWMEGLFTAGMKIITMEILGKDMTADDLVKLIDDLIDKDPAKITEILSAKIPKDLAKMFPDPLDKMLEAENIAKIFQMEIAGMMDSYKGPIETTPEAIKIAAKLDLETILSKGTSLIETVLKQAWARSTDAGTGLKVKEVAAKIIEEKLAHVPGLSSLTLTNLAVIAMQAMNTENPGNLAEEIVKILKVQEGVLLPDILAKVNEAIPAKVQAEVTKWTEHWKVEANRNRFFMEKMGAPIEQDKVYTWEEVTAAIKNKVLEPIQERFSKSNIGVRFFLYPFRAIYLWYVGRKALQFADKLGNFLRQEKFIEKFFWLTFQASKTNVIPDLKISAMAIFNHDKTAEQIKALLPNILGNDILIRSMTG